MKIQIDKQVIEQALEAMLDTEASNVPAAHLDSAITALQSALAESVEPTGFSTNGFVSGGVTELGDFRPLCAKTIEYGKPVPWDVYAELIVEKAAESVEQEPVTLYPCGFRELQRLVIQRGAFLAQGLQEDEPLTDSLRNAVMDVIGYARDMSDLLAKQPLYTHPAPAVPEVEQLRDELASALEDLDREVKIGNDLIAENAKYRDALEMARYAIENGPRWNDGEQAYNKIEEVLK